MAQIPYNPVARPHLAGDEEIAAMHAKLASKIKPKVEVMPHSDVPKSVDHVAVGAASTENTLRWERPAPQSRLIYSKGRQYRCRKWSGAHATDEHKDWKYQLEKLVEDRWYYACGPICESFEEIRKLAQADFARGTT